MGACEQCVEAEEDETERTEIVLAPPAEETDTVETAAVQIPKALGKDHPPREAEVSCTGFITALLQNRPMSPRPTLLAAATSPRLQALPAPAGCSASQVQGQDVSTSTEDLEVLPQGGCFGCPPVKPALFGGPPPKSEDEKLVTPFKAAEKEELQSRLAEAEAVIAELRWQAEAWRQPLSHPTPLARLPPLRAALPDRSLHAAVEAILHLICSRERCRPMGSAKVVHVRPIVNDMLWQSYQNSRESMRVQHLRTLSSAPTPISPDVPEGVQEHFPWIAQSMDSTLNERLVFHGTGPEFVEQIAQRGFDERLANLSGLYGAGIYFAEQSCKSLRYSGTGSLRCLLLTRVLLGEPYFATGPMRSMRRPPPLEANDPQQGLYDSVVADKGTPTGRPGDDLQHRVFVLFEGKQAYPEMAVYFEICS